MAPLGIPGNFTTSWAGLPSVIAKPAITSLISDIQTQVLPADFFLLIALRFAAGGYASGGDHRRCSPAERLG